MDSTFDRAGEAVVYIGIAVGIIAPRSLASGTGHLRHDRRNGRRVHGQLLARQVGEPRLLSGTGMANVGLAPREVRTVLLVWA